jgi:hypothetical protein
MGTPDVRIGQVWADNDKRSAGRTLRIDHIGDEDHDGYAVPPYASCTVLTNKPGRRTRHQVAIRLSRFKPNATGYRLLSEPEGHFWACPKPDCDTPRDQYGDCPDCGEPLRPIGADGYEVTT